MAFSVFFFNLWYNVFSLHPRCNVYQNFTPLYAKPYSIVQLHNIVPPVPLRKFPSQTRLHFLVSLESSKLPRPSS